MNMNKKGTYIYIHLQTSLAEPEPWMPAYVKKKNMILTFNLQLSPTSGLILLIQASLKYTISLKIQTEKRMGIKKCLKCVFVDTQGSNNLDRFCLLF